MKFRKDGGPDSTVSGLFFCEMKRAFTVVLLKFEGKSREAYHTHAFDAVSWVLAGKLREEHLNGTMEEHAPSLFPVLTFRSTFHKVDSDGTTWVMSFRGPWEKTWTEFLPELGKMIRLTHGRKHVPVNAGKVT